MDEQLLMFKDHNFEYKDNYIDNSFLNLKIKSPAIEDIQQLDLFDGE